MGRRCGRYLRPRGMLVVGTVMVYWNLSDEVEEQVGSIAGVEVLVGDVVV